MITFDELKIMLENMRKEALADYIESHPKDTTHESEYLNGRYSVLVEIIRIIEAE
jgi:hypothetical protein